MSFDFATATNIVFGRGAIAQLKKISLEMGSKALVVTGADEHRFADHIEVLRLAGLQCNAYSVKGEPTIQMVRDGLGLSRSTDRDMVIGLGGGGAIDTAKAIAALMTNGGDPLDYIEIIGKGLPLTKRSVPMIAVPTTAGTGSEVTRNAVLKSEEHWVKASIRSSYMLPTVALVDPELTVSMSAGTTAATGMDALTQVIEPYVSRKANPITDALCREGITRGARSLRKTVTNPNDMDAREDMSVTALLGGICLANAGLGAVHGIAGAIGGWYLGPHGAVCARLLAPVMAMNINIARRTAPNGSVMVRYRHVARLLTSNPRAQPEDGVEFVKNLCADLNIPGLGAYYVEKSGFERMIRQALQSSSMKGNPVTLEDEHIAMILEQAL